MAKKGWGDTSPGKGSGTPRMEDLVDTYPLTKKYKSIRALGDVLPFAEHWIPIITKDGKNVSIRKPCLGFNPETEAFDGKCPYCEIMGAKKSYLGNFIIRELQEDAPRKPKPPTKKELKKGFKIKGEDSYSPVRVVVIRSSVAQQFQDLIELNKHKDKKTKKTKTYDLSHEKYGCDVLIKLDKDKDPSNMYSVQKGDATKLTEEEKEYLLWNLEEALPTEDLATAKQEAKALLSRIDKKALKKSGIELDDDDEDDDEDMDEEDWDEDDDSPKKKSKSKNTKSKSKKSKRYDDDEDEEDEEDDDEDYDEDDEDEDEKPRKSKKSKSKNAKSKSKKSKRKYDDEDEEEDEEDDDDWDEDDDEEDSPKKKSKSKNSKKSKRKSRDEDDEDDEDDDWDDEDDD